MPDDEYGYPLLKPDPLDGEPPDKTPLYYRASADTIIMDDGRTLNDVVHELYYLLETHHHDPEDIDETPEDQFVSQDQIDLWTRNTSYTNSRELYESHGGLLEGMSFDAMELQDFFDTLLYPYLPPVIESAELLAPASGVYSVETPVYITKVKVTVKKKSDNIRDIKVLAGTTTLYSYADGVSEGGTFTINLNGLVHQTDTIYVEVEDEKDGITQYPIGEIKIVDPIFYGTLNTDSAPTASQIATLSKVALEKSNDDIVTVTSNNTRMVIAYPSAYGDLKKIIDVNGLELLNTFDKSTANVTVNGAAVAYTVYMNNRSTTSNYDLNMIW